MLMKRIYSSAIAVKGFSGIVAQTLLFRELLVLFGGKVMGVTSGECADEKALGRLMLGQKSDAPEAAHA